MTVELVAHRLVNSVRYMYRIFQDAGLDSDTSSENTFKRHSQLSAMLPPDTSQMTYS